MAIIINDYKPSGDLVEVQFPGSKTRYKIPYADDVITLDVQEQFARGDYSAILEHLPEAGQKKMRALYKPQLEDFVEQWLGAKPGN